MVILEGKSYIDRAMPSRYNKFTRMVIYVSPSNRQRIIDLLSIRNQTYQYIKDENWTIRFIDGQIYSGYKVLVDQNRLSLGEKREKLVTIEDVELYPFMERLMVDIVKPRRNQRRSCRYNGSYDWKTLSKKIDSIKYPS